MSSPEELAAEHESVQEEQPQQNAEYEETVEPKREETSDPDLNEGDELEEVSEEPEERRHVDDGVYKVKMGRKERDTTTTTAPKRRARRARARGQDDEQDEQQYGEEEQPQELDEEDEEVRQRRELEERLDAALKPSTKRRKIAGQDIEAMQDDRIAAVRKEMRNAAYRDVDCIKDGEPALNKIKMLPTVVSVLGKHSLADSILDGNLLESVRIWLEPLPDASLPSYEIQKELFGALERLPIKTLHLRESGLGRVVLFYQKSKRPHATIKRSADRLIGNWMRPIMGRSDDYRDKQVETARYNPVEGLSNAGGKKEAKTLAEDLAERRNRAAIPTSRGETYRVAPQNLTADQVANMARTNDSQLRRMKNKLAASSRSQKKTSSKVSIEGRGLH